MYSDLSSAQYAALLRPLRTDRVGKHKGHSHMQAWDIRRTMIRIFGFANWDQQVISCDLVREIETKTGDRSRWTVVYRVLMRLTIKDKYGEIMAVYEDGAAGGSSNQPLLDDAHDNALKTAMSQALKRCAINLGDQFGLALYNRGGQPDENDERFIFPVVGVTLLEPPRSDDETGTGQPELPADPVVLPGPDDEPQEPQDWPEVAAPPVEPEMISEEMFYSLDAMWDEIGYRDGAARRKVASMILRRNVEGFQTLTMAEAKLLSERLIEKRREVRLEGQTKS